LQQRDNYNQEAERLNATVHEWKDKHKDEEKEKHAERLNHTSMMD